jgi:hypothetical protein
MSVPEARPRRINPWNNEHSLLFNLLAGLKDRE